MSIWECYAVAFLPLIAAVILWLSCKKVVWWEALVLSVSGFAISTAFYFIVSYSMYDDVETWSGQVEAAVHTPPWTEYYEYAVYRTEYYTVEVSSSDSKGRTRYHTETRSRQVFDHWEPTTRYHNDEWNCSDTLVSSYSIGVSRFEDIHRKFGGLTAIAGVRYTYEHNSHMISGDPHDYQTVNIKNYVYPVTTVKHWVNRVKACPSVFSYQPVPPDVKVFEYPINDDHFSSNRVLGPVGISVEQWDILNAKVGPIKKVNLIICAFGTDSGLDMGECQERKWIGGKKNDIIITYGGGTNDAKPSWCHVFGWSESDLAKLNIESLILKNGINDKILPMIQTEIVKNYTIKDWHKFDYLKAEIPFSTYIWLIVITLGVGSGWIAFALYNGTSKDDDGESELLGIKHEKARTSYGEWN